MAKILNKKGNAPIDLITILVILVIFGIALIVGHLVLTTVNDDLQADPMITEPMAKQVSGDLAATYPSWGDNMFLTALVLLYAVTMISVFFLDTHPVFFVVMAILLVAAFVVALLLGNAFHDLATDGSFVTFANQFPKMAWIMNHIAQVAIVMGISIGGVLYMKVRNL